LRHKYPESLSKIGVPKNKRHGVEDSLAERLFTPYFNVSYRKFCKAGFGRVEPKRTQGCLPKSCHSLNLGMENFASILSDRLWPIVTIRFVPEIIPNNCRSKSAM
jgi:hypothetical protein